MFRKLSIAVLVVLALAALSACKKGSTDLLNPDLDAGTEGGLCLEDDTCNEGLVCDEGFCIAAVAGEVGGACLEDGSCNEGLACEDDVCVELPDAGEEGGACLDDGTCNEGLVCASGTCVEFDAQIITPITVSRIEKPVITIRTMPCPAGMVLVKGGTFTMGKNDEMVGETPIHGVTLSDFCMDRTEFTNGDKDAAVFAGYLWPAERVGFGGDKQPLIDMTWNEAKALCELQGKRLPTEAEWEFAARGGEADLAAGTADGAVSDANACWNPLGTRHATCDVGSFDPNPLGLYDMAGNVGEWVSDWRGPYSGGAVTDPTGPGSGTEKVVRGGAWNELSPHALSAALRAASIPERRYAGFGFRCVADPQD